MKAGISTKILKNQNLFDAVRRIAENGYKVVEIWSEHLQRDVSDLGECRSYLAQFPVEYLLHGPTQDLNISSTNKKIRKVSIGEYIKAVEIAAALNIPSISMHPGRLTSNSNSVKETMGLFLTEFGYVLEKAAKLGIQINLEGMEQRPKEFIIRPCEIKQVIDFYNNELLGVTIDIAHVNTVENINLEEYWQAGIPIKHVHISDSGYGHTHLPLGWGILPLKEIFQFLEKQETDSFVIEGSVPDKAEEVLKNNIDYWREYKNEYAP